MKLFRNSSKSKANLPTECQRSSSSKATSRAAEKKPAPTVAIISETETSSASSDELNLRSSPDSETAPSTSASATKVHSPYALLQMFRLEEHPFEKIHQHQVVDLDDYSSVGSGGPGGLNFFDDDDDSSAVSLAESNHSAVQNLHAEFLVEKEKPCRKPQHREPTILPFNCIRTMQPERVEI